MATKHYILGWIKSSPTHGYSLKKCYQEFINPDEKLSDAKLYPLFREMEKEGLIEKKVVDMGTGPVRKVIHITKKGKEAFLQWLESSAEEGYETRPRYDFFRAFPFLVKFPFFYELERETIVKKLKEQHQIHVKRLEGYRGARQKMVAKGLAECKLQALDFGIMLEEAKISWLEKMISLYQDREETQNFLPLGRQRGGA